jgi:xanthine dehydrogenase accessory factor
MVIKMKEDTGREQLRYKIRLRIYKNDLVFGPGVAELMEHIEETGTLSQACRKMGMAYSKGWKILKRAEDDLGFSLVEGTRGGAHGGKMSLTREGEEFIDCYRKMDRQLHQAADDLFARYFFSDRYPQKGETVSEQSNRLIIVRGGGDLATGTIAGLWHAGFPVLVLETEYPAAIRRQVSLCEAIYEGQIRVEDMEAVRIDRADQAEKILRQGKIPILADAAGESIRELHPAVVVDAILAKKNLGTHRDMAGFTIALGPGFCAGEDVDVVVETKRGHNLGRLILQGEAAKNSGIPGNIGGYTSERVIHAQAEGILKNRRNIGDIVEQGETIALIETKDGELPVTATITGIIRGLIRDGYPVTEGFKIADIDPRREELQNCFTISDKARCIGGSVLEAVCRYFAQEK